MPISAWHSSAHTPQCIDIGRCIVLTKLRFRKLEEIKSRRAHLGGWARIIGYMASTMVGGTQPMRQSASHRTVSLVGHYSSASMTLLFCRSSCRDPCLAHLASGCAPWPKNLGMARWEGSQAAQTWYKSLNGVGNMLLRVYQVGSEKWTRDNRLFQDRCSCPIEWKNLVKTKSRQGLPRSSLGAILFPLSCLL
jgi:hypothetical protein